MNERPRKTATDGNARDVADESLSRTVVSATRTTDDAADGQRAIVEETFVAASPPVDQTSELSFSLAADPGRPNALVAGHEKLPEWQPGAAEPRRFGRYVLLGLIGRGGMGDVYRAVHVRLQKPVALKILAAHREDDHRARGRFAREVRALCELSHPNLVRIETAGEHQGLPYLVMEQIDGVDLAELVSTRGSLPVADACQLVGQVALGLSHLHDKGLVHRDIKPSNLIIDAAGVVKIADLGIARDLDDDDELTPDSRVVGDPHFIPPEYLDSAAKETGATIRGDIYSLGCTLFTLLTGRPPFHDAGPSPTEILSARLRGRLPRLSDYRDDVPASLQKVLDAMMARDPDKRPATPMQVVAALAPLAVGCDLKALTQHAEFRRDDHRSDDNLSTAEYLRDQAARSAELAKIKRRSPRMILIAATLIGWVSLAIALLNDPQPEQIVHEAGPSSGPLPIADHQRDHQWEAADAEWTSGTITKTVPVVGGAISEPPPPDITRDLVSWIDPDRDAIDLQAEVTADRLTIGNLKARGILQLPVITPDRYSLEMTVERLEGEGSFGIGFSVGSGRLLAIVDHRTSGHLTSGMMAVDENRKRIMIDPLERELLPVGEPVRFRLRVSTEQAELFKLAAGDPAATSKIGGEVAAQEVGETTRVAGWSRRGHGEDNSGADSQSTVDLPQLRQFDGFYPDVFFLHAFEATFAVHDLRFTDFAEPPRPQPFKSDDATAERKLAETIVWRGGHVEIITESATKTVHSLDQLTDEPWLIGVEKCGASPRLAIRDREIFELAKVRGLQRLELYDCDISADALAALTGIHSLQTLVLAGRRIDGSGVARLEDLPALRKLQLLGMSVPEAALESVERFPGLTSFCISNSQIAEPILAQTLRRLPNLQHLCLSRTNIEGDCLPALVDMRYLQEVQLDDTRIDDDDLASLKLIPSLQTVVLADTAVSEQAAVELENENPGLKVVR